jgi:hypothetical protein
MTTLPAYTLFHKIMKVIHIIVNRENGVYSHEYIPNYLKGMVEFIQISTVLLLLLLFNILTNSKKYIINKHKELYT